MDELGCCSNYFCCSLGLLRLGDLVNSRYYPGKVISGFRQNATRFLTHSFVLGTYWRSDGKANSVWNPRQISKYIGIMLSLILGAIYLFSNTAFVSGKSARSSRANTEFLLCMSGPVLISDPELTLMLLAWCKNQENDWNPGKWVLIWECPARAIQWIPAR